MTAGSEQKRIIVNSAGMIKTVCFQSAFRLTQEYPLVVHGNELHDACLSGNCAKAESLMQTMDTEFITKGAQIQLPNGCEIHGVSALSAGVLSRSYDMLCMLLQFSEIQAVLDDVDSLGRRSRTICLPRSVNCSALLQCAFLGCPRQ